MIDGISGRPAGLNGSSVRVGAAATQAADLAKTGKSEGVESTEGAPRVELSALATAARDAAAAPIDTTRVAELRAAIANGSYTVDPEKIAAKMVELDLGWAGKAGDAE